MTLRIGVASCFFHGDPARPVFKGKTLLYLEESIAHWLMAGGAIPYLLPTPSSNIGPADLIATVDGLLLQGGTDLSPLSYGQAPIKPEWAGDAIRDQYETALINAAMEQNRPILGVCRGLQMLNVAFGGTLYQDISTQRDGSQTHRDYGRYDGLEHDITVEGDSWLARMHGAKSARVNSVHHQGIDQLAKPLRVEARSVPDGVIEAVRHESAPYIYGVQWHPEFQDPSDSRLLDPAPVRDAFLEAARSAVEAR